MPSRLGPPAAVVSSTQSPQRKASRLAMPTSKPGNSKTIKPKAGFPLRARKLPAFEAESSASRPLRLSPRVGSVAAQPAPNRPRALSTQQGRMPTSAGRPRLKVPSPEQKQVGQTSRLANWREPRHGSEQTDPHRLPEARTPHHRALGRDQRGATAKPSALARVANRRGNQWGTPRFPLAKCLHRCGLQPMIWTTLPPPALGP